MNSQEVIEQIKVLIKGFASKQSSISLDFFDDIRSSVIQITCLNPGIDGIADRTINDYYEIAVKEYKSVNPVDIDPSTSLTKKGFHTWLTEERKKLIPKNYIDRYLKYLRKEGRSENVIVELTRSSEAILGKLGDPQSSAGFYIKGLVVGSVQSGKTGNFNAVINRAVDAGYNLVIILSGIMEDLRSQTQLRLEMDVIGEGVINIQTEQQGMKGVGNVSRFGVQGNSDIPQVFSITSHKSDFKKQVQDANFSLNNKNILVCKKNTGVLKNLLIWLSDYLTENSTQHDIPLLIVDDEADNASLNNLGHKGREYANAINGHIRAILALFSRKTYLGYTATPFANVLQDRNDAPEGQWTINYKRNGELVSRSFNQVDNIFPNDFIELLAPPSNYIGAKQIFETRAETRKIPLVEPVEDCFESFPMKVIDELEGIRSATEEEIENLHTGLRSPKKDDLFPMYLPDSLKDAIECFVLSIAIRLKRRPTMVGSKLFNPHSTMLIHVSRFTDWQNRTKDLILLEVTKIIERITTELPSSNKSIYSKLEKTWYQYYAAIIENIRTYLPEGYSDEFLDVISFDDIKPLLPETVKGLEVKAINSVTKEKLIYTTDAAGIGKKYIAIGGNRLSRGFTLEGLTINYFIRDTNYADTLLQMGRWFGYRPGYIDCCKLFTTWAAIEKFNATTLTIEELELEFKKMHRLGKTPEDFVLRVRNHPGVLKITRPSILKNAVEVKWSYQDTLVQTSEFKLNSTRINESWIYLKKLFNEFIWTDLNDRGFYITDTDINGLIRFLDSSNTFYKYEDELVQIKKYLTLCQENQLLLNWRIAIKNTGGSGHEIFSSETKLPRNIHLTVRSSSSAKESLYYKQLITEQIFTGSGKSANIISSGLDMAVFLNDKEIEEANNDFIESKISEFIEDGINQADAKIKAKKVTKPERIYREKMNSNSGVLVIYLMDIREILNDKDEALKNLKISQGIDDTIPLIGYAIGFPPISSETDPGGYYMKGNYNIDEDEPETEEFDEETLVANEDNQ